MCSARHKRQRDVGQAPASEGCQSRDYIPFRGELKGVHRQGHQREPVALLAGTPPKVCNSDTTLIALLNANGTVNCSTERSPTRHLSCMARHTREAPQDRSCRKIANTRCSRTARDSPFAHSKETAAQQVLRKLPSRAFDVRATLCRRCGTQRISSCYQASTKPAGRECPGARICWLCRMRRRRSTCGDVARRCELSHATASMVSPSAMCHIFLLCCCAAS